MPSAIVSRLWTEASKAARTPEMSKVLAQEAAEPVGNSPEQFAATIKSDIARISKLIKDAGIKVD